MSKVDWSKAPEWATCVVKRLGLKEDHHWCEKLTNDAQLHHVKTGSMYKMGDPNCWEIVEKRPTESDAITTEYEPMSLADIHLANLFTPAGQPSTAPDLLEQAAQLLNKRGQQYDKSGNERSAAKIVAAFNTITGRDLTPGEGWLFLTLLKAVRFYSNTETPHRDSLEDMIAYAALHAEEYLNDN